MVQRGSRLGDPNEYVAGADWPGGDLVPGAPVAAQYAQGISRNLAGALAGTTVSELARRSGVHRTTIHELLAGRTWGDVVTIALLEDAAGVPLWPGRPDRRTPATPLVPELDVRDLEASLRFYVDLLGFRVVFRRHDERFAYLAHDGAELMLQGASGPGRRFRTAPLEAPFGRGANFQLAVTDVEAVCERFRAAGRELVLPVEDRWYSVDVEAPGGRWAEAGPTEAGNRQFVAADPDGYLWRPYQDLGDRRLA